MRVIIKVLKDANEYRGKGNAREGMNGGCHDDDDDDDNSGRDDDVGHAKDNDDGDMMMRMVFTEMGIAMTMMMLILYR